jgi:4-carboxymuconolactone decarboxylase
VSDADEAREYLQEMIEKRGYALDYHRTMASNDVTFLKAADNLIRAAYLEPRLLDRRTKELIFITTLTVMRSDRRHIEAHIKVALELGVSPQEILEAIEITMPEAGVVAFQDGVAAWQAVVGSELIEVDSIDAGQDAAS